MGFLTLACVRENDFRSDENKSQEIRRISQRISQTLYNFFRHRNRLYNILH
jgi:hypothetical protein